MISKRQYISIFATYEFNDIKHRLLLYFTAYRFEGQPKIQSQLGGGIYALFTMSRKFKQYPTMSQRGSDIYIQHFHTFENDIRSESYRLSLIYCLDTKAIELHTTDGSTLEQTAIASFVTIQSIRHFNGKVHLHVNIKSAFL